MLAGIAAEAGPLQCAKGLTVAPDHTWATAPPIDVLVYPGGFGSNEEVRTWGAAPFSPACAPGHRSTPTPASSTGGRRRPTGSSLEHLAKLGKDIEGRPDDRFVDVQARQARRYVQCDQRPPV